MPQLTEQQLKIARRWLETYSAYSKLPPEDFKKLTDQEIENAIRLEYIGGLFAFIQALNLNQ